MVLASEAEVISKTTFRLDLEMRLFLACHDLDYFGPGFRFGGEQLRITKDVEATFGAGESDADAVVNIEESDTAVVIAADQ